MSTPIIEPFDIVIIPFPYSDHLHKSKRRPTVVVSRDGAYHHETKKIIVAMITSSTDDWPGDCIIKDYEKAGLHMPCTIRMKLFTIEQSHILERIGRLSTNDRKKLTASLKRILVA